MTVVDLRGNPIPRHMTKRQRIAYHGFDWGTTALAGVLGYVCSLYNVRLWIGLPILIVAIAVPAVVVMHRMRSRWGTP